MYFISSFKCSEDLFQRIQKTRQEKGLNWSETMRKLVTEFLDKVEAGKC